MDNIIDCNHCFTLCLPTETKMCHRCREYTCYTLCSSTIITCSSCQSNFCHKCGTFPPLKNNIYECLSCLSAKPFQNLIPDYYHVVPVEKQLTIWTTLLCLRRMKSRPPKYIRFVILNLIFDEISLLRDLIGQPCRFILWDGICKYPTKNGTVCQVCVHRDGIIADKIVKCQLCPRIDDEYIMTECQFCYKYYCQGCKFTFDLGGNCDICKSCYQSNRHLS